MLPLPLPLLLVRLGLLVAVLGRRLLPPLSLMMSPFTDTTAAESSAAGTTVRNTESAGMCCHAGLQLLIALAAPPHHRAAGCAATKYMASVPAVMVCASKQPGANLALVWLLLRTRGTLPHSCGCCCSCALCASTQLLPWQCLLLLLKHAHAQLAHTAHTLTRSSRTVAHQHQQQEQNRQASGRVCCHRVTRLRMDAACAVSRGQADARWWSLNAFFQRVLLVSGSHGPSSCTQVGLRGDSERGCGCSSWQEPRKGCWLRLHATNYCCLQCSAAAAHSTPTQKHFTGSTTRMQADEVTR